MRTFRALAISISLTLLAMGSNAQMVSTTPDPNAKKELAKYRHAYETAKARFIKIHSKEAKNSFVVSTVKYATASMTSEALTPHVRYPLALHLYREALRLDPSNHEAKNNSDLIISVYKSMHRAIPQD